MKTPIRRAAVLLIAMTACSQGRTAAPVPEQQPRVAPRPAPPAAPDPKPAPRPRADLILTNGAIRTLDPGRPLASAVAILGDTVVAVGGAEVVDAWRGPETTVVNLAGAAVAPSFVDHHVHLFNVGYSLLNEYNPDRMFLDLAPATAISQVASGVKRRAASLARGEWVLGTGWSQSQWGTERLPTHDILTVSATRHPVFLTRVDGHAGWANQPALERAGLWDRGPDPEGGRVVRTASGRPTGVLLERANEPLVALLPPLADADIIRSYRLGAAELAGRGVTHVYDAGALAPPGIVALNLDLGRYLTLLRRTDADSALPLSVSLMIPAPSRLADSLLAAPSPRWELSPRLRITHLKLFADGALGSRGAALSHRYHDDPGTSGVARMRTEEIVALAERALDRGLGVAVHATGDLAVGRTLDAFEAILGRRPDLDRRRLRIEHFSYASDADLARAARLGIVLSIQSSFNAFPEDRPTFAATRVGARNADRVYAWDRLARAGAVLAEGSDYFTRPTFEFTSNFQATLTRVNAVGASRPDAEGRLLSWRMNATWHPAAGRPRDPAIRAGSAANLILMTPDPFAVPRDRIWATKIIATVREGRASWAVDSLRAVFDD